MTIINDIWHGDSIEKCKIFQPKRMVQCVITDPPFGTANLSNSSVTPEGKTMARKIANDETPEIAIATFKAVFASLLPAMRDESDIYVFTSYQVLKEWLVMTDAFFEPYRYQRKAVLVWEKDGPGMGDLNTGWGMGCEFILYFKRGNREKLGNRRNNVLHVPQLRPSALRHPHEKPVGLLELLIKNSAAPGEFVVDPFAGSGSTVVAARNCGVSAIGIEYDELNYNLAKEYLNQTSEGMF